MLLLLYFYDLVLVTGHARSLEQSNISETSRWRTNR
jgi:hypothetical protein